MDVVASFIVGDILVFQFGVGTVRGEKEIVS